jgi:ribosomal protein L37E
MAYQLELQNGQHLILENRGAQTLVTLTTSGPGQQQQSSQSIQTGAWTSPPVAYRTAGGVMIHLHTAEGDRTLIVQHNQIQMATRAPSVQVNPMPLQEVSFASSTSMSSMPPMKPMQPMQPMGTLSMGNMHMSMNPMEMQMGDMALSMKPSTTAETQSESSTTRRFCTQCGHAVNPSDRFCASCGHALTEP